MLTRNHCETWNHFLSHLEERCSEVEFQNWIAPIKVTEGTSEELVVSVPNIFVQEYLLQNYQKDLLLFFPAKHNGEPAIQFIIQENSENRENNTQIEPLRIDEDSSLKLNPYYTFDNFIEGPSNQFVKSAALGVASHLGRSYNPLFIHGKVGLGKTHILHSIGHYVKKNQKRLRIQCITTEEFINDIVHHLRGKSMDKMKHYYRSLIDILLVDDIQFLENRLNFEEEFCNTFESLINQGKQIVITSDKPPSHLKLSERLTARMEWGLVAQIGVPELETRVAILQHKAEIRGIKLPHKIAFFIAEHIFNNVRQLEGAINRLSAYSEVIGSEVTEEVVKTSLGELLQCHPKKQISIEHILRTVALIFDVRVSDLTGSSRVKGVAFARQVAMYLTKELVADSLMKMASAFGGKTHSTLLHAWKKITKRLIQDENLRNQLQTVRRDLEE